MIYHCREFGDIEELALHCTKPRQQQKCGTRVLSAPRKPPSPHTTGVHSFRSVAFDIHQTARREADAQSGPGLTLNSLARPQSPQGSYLGRAYSDVSSTNRRRDIHTITMIFVCSPNKLFTQLFWTICRG